MKLSEEDATLFFKLMWGVLAFVNREVELVAGADTAETFGELPQEELAKVREVLWKDLGYLERYVAANPDGLPADELTIVERWKRCASGSFYINRFLKKHTVFVAEGGDVYAVLGLHQPLEEVLFWPRTPVMVKAVLLPFKGRIVYDGVLGFYNIHFGGGIRRRMNEDYAAAKQNGWIITTLEPEEEPPKAARRTKAPRRSGGKDLRPAMDELVSKVKKLKGGPPLQSAALSLLRASANLARDAVHDPEDAYAMAETERKVRRALTRLQTVMRRAPR